MSRLVDYFVVVGFDHEKQRGSISSGKVIQRFPEKDWADTPFIDGIELFCQPQGWRLSSHQLQPTFFVSVLTDIDANRHYCACLSFNEPIAIQPIKQPDDEDLYLDNMEILEADACLHLGGNGLASHHSIMYAPKCLVLVSRQPYVETFKNCLGVIYTVYVDGMDVDMETLIGNLLGCIEATSSGGPQVRFSLGAGDRQAVQPPLSPTVPVTGTTVYQLFDQLGIHSVITLFCAVMTEHKLLFHSKSYSRLHDACHALTSLMYPFKYSHVYIPLLPSPLLEVLSTPTPFVMGVHSSLKNEVSDLLDVIIVDLDGGWISVPDCIHLPRLDESTSSELVNKLCVVLRPQLEQADDAFPSSQIKPSPHHILDKEIRAIFVRLFAQLLRGYRSCLQIVRIHPKPFITFHKASFLGQRNLVESEFVVRLLDCMFFNSFVQERGPPYRPCDLFDELYATMSDTLKREAKSPETVTKHIHDLAEQLLLNENPNPSQNFQLKLPLPTEGAFMRTHQPAFPQIKSEKIKDLIESERIQREMTTRRPSLPSGPKPRIVPMGPRISSMSDGDSALLITNSARRLEVMRNCINCIFENKISDARKTFPAVLRALKNKSARLALAEELSLHVTGNKAVLEHEQFDLIVRLMNCALQQDCDNLGGTSSGLSGHGDVNGVAAAMLPLAMAFCRRLCTGVIQFAYTCIQEHRIWDNLGFWESTFYQDVERDIRSLYVPNNHKSLPSSSGSSPERLQLQKRSPSGSASSLLDPTTLDVTAEQLRLSSQISEENLAVIAQNEESTVYSQAIHFSNRIVALKVPLDIIKHEKGSKANISGAHGDGHSDSNSNVTGTGAGRDSNRDERDHERDGRDVDNESGFEEDRSGSNGRGTAGTTSEIGANVIKFVGRFVDKVCTEGDVSEDHVKALHQMIPGVVAMQIETLEAVHRESRRLPPITKPKIVSPNLLSGEELTMQGLRVYLIPDGRDEAIGSNLAGSANGSSALTGLSGGPILLPAEGAIFLTNYRIIFRGRPCDPFSSESVIVRSFPIATLTKEKRINLPSSYLIATIDHYIQEGLQLRSNTFQLLRIAFDEEVTSDAVEMFRKLINKERSPPDIFHLFAFTSQIATAIQINYLNLQKQKVKNATLRGMAKKTLLKTAARAGLPVKSKHRKHKYLLPPIPSGPGSSKTFTHMRQLSPTDSLDEKSLNDDVSVSSDSSHLHSTNTMPSGQLSSGPTGSPGHALVPNHVKEKDTRTLHKLTELGYIKDYQRLGLGNAKDVVHSSVSFHAYPSSLINSSSSSKLSRTNPNALQDSFRISSVNVNYSVTRSYPAFVAVPASVTDDSIRKFSRCYRHYRFPCVVWKHPRSKGLLFRGSCFHGKGVIGMFKGASGAAAGANSASSETSANLEQEKYFRTIITLTPSHFLRNPLINGSSISIPSLVFGAPQVGGGSVNSMGSMERLAGTPDSPRKIASGNSFQKAMSTLRNSGGKGTMGSLGATMGRQFQKLSHVNANLLHNHKKPGHFEQEVTDRGSSSSSSVSSAVSSNPPPAALNRPISWSNSSKVSLYVFGEKAQIKNVKTEQYPNCDFIPVDFHEVRHVKQSFKKLTRACCPSTPVSTDPDQSFYRQLENSEWLNQLQTVMQISGAIVDLIDIQGSSVMVCLEDGWDLVPQIVSVSEICLDPYYRTFEGFKILIEKEWLAFGHRFSHRSNHTAATLTSGFAPIFLQFLDIVHQIMLQFPLSFEFNQYYLKFVAYHYVSCRFRTYLLDNECERAEFGWLLEDVKKRLDYDDDFDFDMDDSRSTTSGGPNNSNSGTLTATNNANHFNFIGTSFWDYAERIWSKSSIFYNFYYIPTSCQETELAVLRPYSNLTNIKVWDYFLEEDLVHGPSYDVEVVTMERQRQEEMEATNQTAGGSNRSSRKIVNACYDSIPFVQNNAISQLLDAIRQLETHLGFLPAQKWSTLWSKIEIPLLSTTSLSNSANNYTDTLSRHGSITTQIIRTYCRSNHKRSTINFLVRGKMMGSIQPNNNESTSNQLVYSHRSHRFDKYNYTTPTNCDYCRHVLWGLVKTGMKCSECGYNCHEKCLEFVAKNCQGYKGLRKLSITQEGLPPTGGSPAKPSIAEIKSNGYSEESEEPSTNGTVSSNNQNGYLESDSKSSTIQHSNTYYDQLYLKTKPLAENRTHEGYLFKKGSLLKSWKKRWFVLDSIKHQLRYYDNSDDEDCKGLVELAEVVSALPVTSNPGAPFFDLKTSRRMYNFMASDGPSAQEWIEKIQACLQ